MLAKAAERLGVASVFFAALLSENGTLLTLGALANDLVEDEFLVKAH